MKSLSFAVLLVVFPLSFSILNADTVEMRNGRFIRCRILSQSRTLVKIQTTRGRVRWIHKRRIRRIRYAGREDSVGKKAETKKKEAEKKKKEKENRAATRKKGTQKKVDAHQVDVVRLKSGRTVRGRILSRRGKVIKIRTTRGRIRWIAKRRIRTIAAAGDRSSDPAKKEKSTTTAAVKKEGGEDSIQKPEREKSEQKQIVKHEIIVLKSGRKIEGRILSRRGRIIRIRTKQGRIRRISKRRIRKIKTVTALINNQTNTSTQNQAEAKKREDARRLEEAKKREDARRLEEAKKREDARRREKDRVAALLNEKKKEKPVRKSSETEKRGERKVTEVTEEPSTVSVSRRDALLRSAILPGWGQWSQNRRKIGIAYGGAFAAGALAAYDANRFYLNARRDLAALNNPFSTGALAGAALGISLVPDPIALQDPVAAYLYSQPFIEQQAAVDKHYANFRMASIALLALYAWNLFDAYFFHPTTTAQQPALSGTDEREPGIFMLLQPDPVTDTGGDRTGRRTSAAEQRFDLGIRQVF